METKEELRKRLITQRDLMAPDVWTSKSKMIEKIILQSTLYNQCDHLFIYADYHGEVGTTTLIEDALIKGKAVYLPKVLENFEESRMDFFRVYNTFELVNGYKGIREPMGNSERCFSYPLHANEKMLMLVPGVCFDKHGNRLGYGKGYYDNYLKDKPNMIKIGLCFAIQMLDEIPVNERDIRLDLVLSEESHLMDINRICFR